MEKTKKRRKNLSQDEKMEMVKLYYLEGVSQSELARKHGTSQTAVSKIISKFAAENDKNQSQPRAADNRNQSIIINPST